MLSRMSPGQVAYMNRLRNKNISPRRTWVPPRESPEDSDDSDYLPIRNREGRPEVDFPYDQHPTRTPIINEDSPYAPDPQNDGQSLETAVTNALYKFFPKLKKDDSKAEFFAVYKAESEQFDREYMVGYDEDLNATLIFAGLFSAVTTAFIIDVQADLKPNYAQETTAWLQVLSGQLSNSTISANAGLVPRWSGPDPVVVDVQTLLYSSLAASLLAAFIAVLGKQWLNRYMRGQGGSVIDRCLDRQRKWEGMENWRFHVVMEMLLLMLQVALLLLGCAISRYLWTIDHTVAVVPIAVTSFGVVFYLGVSLSATISYECPFQTPVSLSLRYIFEHRKRDVTTIVRIIRPALSAFTTIFSTIKKTCRLILVESTRLLRDCWSSERVPTRAGPSADVGAQVELAFEDRNDFVHMAGQVELLFEDREDLTRHLLNARCIKWMLETWTDPEVTLVTMAFIPEVEWHSGINSTPSLTSLYEPILEYFDFTAELPILHAGSRENAYTAAKAFLHLYVQRCCLNPQEQAMSLRSSKRLPVLSTGRIDDELDSILCMIDYMLDDANSRSIRLNEKPKFEPAHLSWICRILLYHTWQCCTYRHRTVPYDLDWYLEYCLTYRPSLPAATISDCLLMIGLRTGLPLRVEDLSVVDKSKCLPDILKRLYIQMTAKFRDKNWAIHLRDVLQAMRLLTLWRQRLDEDPRHGPQEFLSDERSREVVQNASYSLCQAILDSSVPEAAKWDALRMTLQIAFKTDSKVLPNKEDATSVFKVLRYLILLPIEKRRQVDYEDTVANAFSALKQSTKPEHFDDMDGRLYEWICWSIAPQRLSRLKTFAFDFLYGISDAIFHPDRSQFPPKLCADLSFALRELSDELSREEREEYTKILARLALSPMWHPHLFAKHFESQTCFHWIDIWLHSADAELRSCVEKTKIALHDHAQDPMKLVLAFNYLPNAWWSWIEFRKTQVSRQATIYGFVKLMAFWVKAAWDLIGVGWQPPNLIFDVTEQIYDQGGGETAMDEMSIERWLHAAWTQFSTGTVNTVVKDATMAFLRRKGKAGLDGLKSSIDFFRTKLHKNNHGDDLPFDEQLCNVIRLEYELERIFTASQIDYSRGLTSTSLPTTIRNRLESRLSPAINTES